MTVPQPEARQRQPDGPDSTPASTPAQIAQARDAGFCVHHIDCTTPRQMLADLARALHWQDNLGFTPEGLNLDALFDALHHEPNPRRPRLALVFDGMAALRQRDPRRAALLPGVITDRATELQGSGLRLLAWFPEPHTHAIT